MGSPDANQPPITLPINPSKSAVAAPRAALRVALGVSSFHCFTFRLYSACWFLKAAVSSAVALAPGGSGRTNGVLAGVPPLGVPPSAPYQPPKRLPAPSPAVT